MADHNEKINFYINTDLMLNGDRKAVINKTAAITKALKNACLSRNDFISFIRSEKLQDLPAATGIVVRDIIYKGRLRYNTCLDMGGCRIFLLRNAKVKYQNGSLRWDGSGTGWDFSFAIPDDTPVTFEQHENDFSSEALCAMIACKDVK
ncbi:MAG: hypothetical protein ACOX1J_03685 [Dethiobacteria bacterium]